MTLYLLIILIGCEVVRSHDTQSMGWMINQQQKIHHLPIVTIMSYFKEFKCPIILQSLRISYSAYTCISHAAQFNILAE